MEQPKAKPGDKTYCLVSGAVFAVGEQTVRRARAGQTYFLCCQGCADYFDANAEKVLAARGLAG